MPQTIQILICAIDDDIRRVPDVLLPPSENVGYVISLQYTDETYLERLPDAVSEREDVVIGSMYGRGLSRNRNNALSLADADILLVSDVDCRYTLDWLNVVRKSFEMYCDADIICFSADSYDGCPLKKYPAFAMNYTEACRQGYYPSSFEIAIKKEVKMRFDERFGLGSELLCAGEEDVFLKDALDEGYGILFVPECIVETNPNTTGCHFIGNPRMQVTKGAVFRYLFGIRNAIWRSMKEAVHHFIYSGANPFAVFFNMIKGIWIFR